MVGNTKNFKLIICGDPTVGKTSLRKVYMGEQFAKTYTTTLGADFSLKDLEINDTRVKLQIWDLAGQYKFNKIRAQYYRNASGILLVFDLTNKDSFNNIPDWLDEYMTASEGELVPILLIGNKHDLIKNKQYTIPPEEIEQYMEQLQSWGKSKNENFQIFYALTSARYDLNVEPSFNRLTEMMITNGNN